MRRPNRLFSDLSSIHQSPRADAAAIGATIP